MSSIIRGRGELNVDKCPPNLVGGEPHKIMQHPLVPAPGRGLVPGRGPCEALLHQRPGEARKRPGSGRLANGPPIQPA